MGKKLPPFVQRQKTQRLKPVTDGDDVSWTRLVGRGWNTASLGKSRV